MTEVEFVGTLPAEWRPGPDFFGFPWEPVMVTFLMGYISFLVVLWRTVLTIKRPMYQLTVTQLHQKITQLSDEICQAAGHLSDLKHTIQERGKHLKETEEATQSSTRENKNLQGMCEYLQRVNESAEEQLRASQSALEQHKTKRANQEQLISEIQTSIQSCEKIFESWNAEPLKEAGVLEKDSLEEAEVRAKLQWTLEENERLNHEKEELLKEVKDGEKQRSKLTEEMKMLQKISKDMADSIACKDCDIEGLYDQISKLGGLKADAQCETVTIQEGNVDENQMKKTIKEINIVSQIQLTAKAEELDRNLAKLADEEKARREREEKRRNLEHRNLKTAQHKLEILRDLYEQTWNTLRQKLLQEEHRHGEKEERLFEGNGNPVQANKQLKIYKERLHKIQEKLNNTQYYYAYQNLSCEKAMHEKWLQKRAAERTLQVQKDENANLRQKLVEAHIRLGNVQIQLTPTHRVTQSLPQHSRACVQPLTASETPLDGPKNAAAGIPSSSPGTLMAGSSCSASSKKRSAPRPINASAFASVNGTAAQPMKGAAFLPMNTSIYPPIKRPIAQPINRKRPIAQPISRTAAQPMKETAFPPNRPAIQPMNRPTGQPMNEFLSMNRPFHPPMDRSEIQPMNRPPYPPLDRHTYPPMNRPPYPPLDRHTCPPMNRPPYPPLDRHTYSPMNRPPYPPLDRHTYPPMNRPPPPTVNRST